MENTKNTILVTWDFTEVSEYALEHAVRIAKVVDNEIAMINIVKKSKEISSVTDRMNKVAEDVFNKNYIKPTPIVRTGSIFTTINEVTEEIGANLVIMGTHGMKGMQKITGSWALKVIAGSKVPFIVVQKAPEREHYSNIVFPVDFRQESKEKLKWAYYLSKYYNLKIHILYPTTTDELFLKQIRANLTFAKKYLSEKGIDFEISSSEGKHSFSDETIKFAQDTKADLILIMTTKDLSFQDYVFGASEQQIIANKAGLSIMCINPRTDLLKTGGFY